MKKKIIIVIIIFIIVTISSYYIFFKKDIMYENEDFNISKYISSFDKDNDGIDDQSDILMGVRNYIATKPKYKSKYYSTGYPDDGYGVCTDVVIQGFLSAGYDLQTLVSRDIKNNPDDYSDDVGDKNIDFRRVRNLKVYFDHNLVSLTVDPKEISSWQGGDIVVWANHVGIISDKRNKKGIPYVIHHLKYQKDYEEDILDTYGKIIGHYRIN